MNREDVIELLDMDDDDLDSYCSDPDEPVMSGSDDEFSDLEQENVDDAECNVERKRKHRPDNDIDSSGRSQYMGMGSTSESKNNVDDLKKGAAAIRLRLRLRLRLLRRPCGFAVLASAQTKVPEGLNTENATENKDCHHGWEELTLRYVQNRKEQMRVAQVCHVDVTSGHFGVAKTVARIKERFVWKGILSDVKSMIAACDVCQKSSGKPLSSQPELHPVPIHSPWYHVGIYFIGPITPASSSGNRFIITLSDYYTKWVDAVPLPSKHATGVAASLLKSFMRMGLPKLLTTDQGKEFRNNLDKQMTELLGVKRQFTTPYHPQHASSLYSPFEVMFGRKAVLPIELSFNDEGKTLLDDYENHDTQQDSDSCHVYLTNARKEILENVKRNVMDAQRIQKRNYSRKRGKGSHFGIGDKVLKKDFRRKKRAGGALDPKWLGPYEVMKDIGKGLFLVKRCDDGKVDHGDHLKVYVVPKQIEYSHKATVEHQESHVSMQENHTVENDSKSHESAYEDCSGESEDEIMQYENSVSQPNAIGNATLQEQLYSSSLLQLWSTTLKSVNVLGNKYFLMDGSDLDAFCLWIYSKRKCCFDKEVTKENLLEPSEPKNSISVPEDNVLLCFEENASDDILMRIVENEQISQICYMPVCKEWQKDRCNSLGLPYIHGNIEHHTTQVMVPVNLCPSSTARFVADGLQDNTGNPQLSSLIKDGERMKNYIEQSKMQLLCILRNNDSIIQYQIDQGIMEVVIEHRKTKYWLEEGAFNLRKFRTNCPELHHILITFLVIQNKVQLMMNLKVVWDEPLKGELLLKRKRVLDTPLQDHSIPRLELLGGTSSISALNQHSELNAELELNPPTLFTDSKPVLFWIQSHVKEWCQFVEITSC
eukprot:Em0004g266a